MIEIVQTGQAGKASLLFDMHRLRTRVFKEMLGWDVDVDKDGLEIDQFDIADAVYLLALDPDKRVIGSWRLLPTTGPTMIRDVWPQFLDSLPMPEDPDVYEVSRFSVHALSTDPVINKQQTQQAIAEMFCALTELCMKLKIEKIFTLYDERIAKVIARINCVPDSSSVKGDISGMTCQTGIFKTNQDMLDRLRQATGIAESIIKNIELPPILEKRFQAVKG